MATPEEQKSRLQSARLRPSADASGQKRNSVLHSNRLRAAALPLGLTFAPSPQRLPNDQQDASEQTDAAQTEEPDRMETFLQQAMSARVQKANAQREQIQQEEAALKKQQGEAKKTVKAALRRGVVFVFNLLAAALDLSSAGVSFIIDIFVYMLTLGWLNLEMIYGKYFAKGKSRFVSPISWAPIPMPVDKDAIILSGFVVAADLALGVAVLMVGIGGLCLIHDFVQVTQSVTAAVKIGVSIAQGGTGGLCFGGIIASGLGL